MAAGRRGAEELVGGALAVLDYLARLRGAYAPPVAMISAVTGASIPQTRRTLAVLVKLGRVRSIPHPTRRDRGRCYHLPPAPNEMREAQIASDRNAA